MQFIMGSVFFSHSEHLTLHIQRAYWMDKDRERFLVDLEQGTADWLPENVRLMKTTRFDGGWTLTFAAKAYEAQSAYSVANRFTDPAGNDVSLSGSVTSFSDAGEGWFSETVPLKNYPGETVYVTPRFSRVTEFETPISITLK